MNIKLTLLSWAFALWLLTVMWYLADAKRTNIHLAIMACMICLTGRSIDVLDATFTLLYAILTFIVIQRYWMDISSRYMVDQYSKMRAKVSRQYIQNQKRSIANYAKKYHKFNRVIFLVIAIGIVSHSIYKVGNL